MSVSPTKSATARQDYYDTLYAGADGVRLRRATLAKIKGVFDAAAASGPLRILDVGCGPGAVSQALAEAGHDVTGVDAAADAVRQAQEQGLTVIRWDLETIREQPLPLDDASFDVVLALDILEHLFDPGALVQEIKRVLKPDGLVVVLFPNHFDIKNRVRILLGKGIVHWDHTFVEPEDYFHIRFWTCAEARRFLERQGLYIHRTQVGYMRWLIGGRWLDFHWRVRMFLVKHFPDLFAGRFVFGARLTPPLKEEWSYFSEHFN